MKIENLHKETCDSLRHYSNLILQTRAIALAQGLIILSISNEIPAPVQLNVIINALGLLLTSFLGMMNANYLNDFKIHLDYLMKIEKDNNFHSSWSVYAEKHNKIDSNCVLNIFTRHGIYIFLGLVFLIHTMYLFYIK